MLPVPERMEYAHTALPAFQHQDKAAPQRGSGPPSGFSVLPPECGGPEAAHRFGLTIVDFHLCGCPLKRWAHLWLSTGLGQGPSAFTFPTPTPAQ